MIKQIEFHQRKYKYNFAKFLFPHNNIDVVRFNMTNITLSLLNAKSLVF